jgi:hypothetical protein
VRGAAPGRYQFTPASAVLLDRRMLFLSDDAKVALDAFVTPVWVVDVLCADVVWANRSALTLFFANTL